MSQLSQAFGEPTDRIRALREQILDTTPALRRIVPA